jgi:hypothetical protein
MALDSIQCPNCGKRIQLSKALTADITESVRKDFEREATEREKSLREDFDQRLRDEQKKALARAKRELAAELGSTKEELEETRKKLESSQKKELQLLKQQKELQDRQASFELDVARRMAEERAKIEKQAGDRIAEQHRLKDQEKDKKLADLMQQIEELKRKAEQGSQQTQGEVAELDLESLLRASFPQDDVDPVPKGVRGADLIHTVRSPQGLDCGHIVWESKNTKSWSDGWLTKVREDQRALKAAVAVIVTAVLPKGVREFALTENVWVCSPSVAVGLATALRSSLVQVAAARATAEGKGSKMEGLYSYLTGAEFRQRVEAVVEAFVSMKEDLDRERRAIEASWAKREKQIGRAVQGLAGMYGDMQGIVGQTLPRVATLELPAGLPEGSE